MEYSFGWFIVVLCVHQCVALAYNSVVSGYQIGVGRADCTGPPVEITFMGYAQLSQKGEGIHLRQFSRAFIVDDGQKRVVFVSVDAGMIGNAVKRAVLQHLSKEFGNMYNHKNVLISGTHTHSSPGGFLTHLLYDLPCLGFIKETFNALVLGIAKSISRAHKSMTDGRLFISEAEILEVNINRSPSAYLNNPEEERNQYKYDVDKTLTQIRFVTSSGKIMGAINWYPVHPTSMNNTNKLVSSDNMGYAAILLEQEYNKGSLIGQGDFVGAFAASNLGDVSPNIMGPKCQYTGDSCDVLTSSCPANAGQCFASGPGTNIFESTKIIGDRIYQGASRLLRQQTGHEILGEVNYIHQFVNMTQVKLKYVNPKTKAVEEVRGCFPAMGYSFAAGTTDGPGAFDFHQGTTSDNPLWNVVRDFIAEPTKGDIECHHPKPILLATGRATFPYDWQPKVVATQLLRIGDTILVAAPGEFTTMSGRRLRNSVRNAALQAHEKDVKVIICGLSNMYTSYVATPEEYTSQRYEGASTLFGPHTLTIYLDQFSKLVQSMLSEEEVDPGPEPAHLEDKNLLTLQTGVLYDGHPYGHDFGTVKVQPKPRYIPGQTVRVVFIAANPRNNLLHEDTFLRVERLDEARNEWRTVATDANWETLFRWTRVSMILGFSDVEILWEIPQGTPAGKYRISHLGYYQYIFGGKFPYNGTSQVFVVDQKG
ncbi:neutral ceramidase-like [Phlebotomus papatasi]|uniref:neutral ceramidase-like n=1 Tax=Phlebotomus papatasi TaxID=29031 RepID=UPI0024833414|nr:neutral ceramidase-like [Phlebotomus papatasi]